MKGRDENKAWKSRNKISSDVLCPTHPNPNPGGKFPATCSAEVVLPCCNPDKCRIPSRTLQKAMNWKTGMKLWDGDLSPLGLMEINPIRMGSIWICSWDLSELGVIHYFELLARWWPSHPWPWSPGSCPTLQGPNFPLKHLSRSQTSPVFIPPLPSATPTLQPPGKVRANEPIWEEKKSPKNPFLPHFHLNLSLQSSCSKKMEKVTPLTHSKRHYTWKNMGKKPIWKQGMDLVGFSEDLGIQTWSPSRILWDSKRT